jgi:putative MATE family efflux protein
VNPLGVEKISKLIWKFAIPGFILYIVTASYNLIDQIFIGQTVGVVGMAATNINFPLSTTLNAVGALIGIGAAARFNLKLGAGDKRIACRIVGNAITSIAIIGVIFTVLIFVFMKPILLMFGATPEIMPYALSYTRVTAIGTPFLMVLYVVNNLIRADGNPIFATISMSIGAVLHVGFTAVFMFVFDMGLAGAALGTIVGQFISAFLGLYYVLKKFKSVKLRKKHYKLSWPILASILVIGMAPFFTQLTATVSQVVLNNMMKIYGGASIYGAEIPIAVSGSMNKINIICMSLTLGVSQGIAPLLSFNYGAKNFLRVRETIHRAMVIVLIFSSCVFVCFQVFPVQIARIFGETDPLYLEFATKFLRIYFFMTFINGVQFVTTTVYPSIGKPQIGAFVGLSRQVIFLIPFMVLLPIKMGLAGVIYAAPIADGLAAITSIILITRELKIMKRAGQHAAPRLND